MNHQDELVEKLQVQNMIKMRMVSFENDDDDGVDDDDGDEEMNRQDEVVEKCII